MTRAAFPLLGTLLVILTGAAADAASRRPPYLPTRDVAVSYRVEGRAAQDVRHLHVRFAASPQRMRVETDDRAMGYLLVDPRARKARMVVPGIGQAIDLPLERDKRAAMLFNNRLSFTRRGTSQFAGHRCTLWDVRGGNDTARACITDDGVILRAEGTGGGVSGSSLEATRVDYQPQSAALFQAPANTGSLSLQDMMRQFTRPQ